ncbi:MAG: hypothetical protein ACRD4O_06505 [Bryobacteraceae bacterium]
MAQASGKPVWGRGGVFTSSCPKSMITAESLFFVEQFQWTRQFGAGDLWRLPAKTADALAVLEEAWKMETQRGQIE